MPFPLDKQFIESTEQQLASKLPVAYVAAMQINNGGEVRAASDDWQLHPISDRSDRKRLTRTSNDVLRETAECKQWEGFPDSALAIAANGTGDRLVLLRSGEHFGAEIWHWDHETGELTQVAEDFAKLKRV